jgi:hypothetical protein
MKVANALTHPSEHPLDDLRRLRVEGRRLHVLLLAEMASIRAWRP